MRSRNLKPSIFKNEHLAKLSPYAYRTFTGLWCLADRKGRLEDRPDRIEAELFPFKFQKVDMDKLLNELQDCEEPFILRYSVESKRYIQIINFEKHQYPHVKECESTIPAPDKHSASTIQARLNPESPILNPESLSPLPPKGGFAQVWARYPSKTNSKAAERHYRASVKTVTDFLDIHKAMDNYLKSDRVKNGFIQNGSTWFNNWRDWINYTEDKHARTITPSGAYIGTQAPVGKYASVTENEQNTDKNTD